MTIPLYKLTRTERRLLASQSPETLAEWAKQLNSWEWPTELGEPEDPKAHDELGSISKTKRWALTKWIEREVGIRLINRIWNSEMTDDQHAEFWVKYAGSNDPPQIGASK